MTGKVHPDLMALSNGDDSNGTWVEHGGERGHFKASARAGGGVMGPLRQISAQPVHMQELEEGRLPGPVACKLTCVIK